MEESNRPLQEPGGVRASDSVDALQGREHLQHTSQVSARTAKTTWLERFKNSNYARAKSSANLALRRDLRKWDYRKLGYADKPCYPRDYSKPISKELEKYYREED